MKSEIKFCLGEITNSLSSYEELIADNLAAYELFELWLDYVTKIDLSELKSLLEKYPGQLLLLTRRRNQETLTLDSALRREIIDLAREHDCIVDLDYTEQREDLDYFLFQSGSGPSDCKLLISYHNYSATPAADELAKLLSEMSEMPAEYYKLACVCQSQADVLRLLHLYQEEQGKLEQLIVLGAGEHGMLSRVAALLWQQPIIYAPRSKEEFIVPGQLTRQQYKDLSAVFKS